MNHRRLLLITFALLLALAALPALAQESAAPQAIVDVTLAVLRDTPSHAGGFVGALPQGTQVTLLGPDDSGRWLQIEAPDGTQGWGRSTHLAPLNQAKTLRTLTLFEAPEDNLNFVTSVQENERVLILETNESGTWTRIMAPDGAAGWTESVLLYPDYGLTSTDVVGRSWPEEEASEVFSLTSSTPVLVEDHLETGWLRIRTNEGATGWVEGQGINVYSEVVTGQVVITESNAANIRELPAADSRSLGLVENGETLLIAGRTPDNTWLLIQTDSRTIAWISQGLVEVPGGVNALPVAQP